MKRTCSLRKNTLALAIVQAMIIDVSSAATIVVDNEADTATGCSFRKAVDTINQGEDFSKDCAPKDGVFGVDDAIDFAVENISLTQGQILINSNVSINKQADTVTITGDNSSRLIEIVDATVSINNVVLSGGSTTFGGGAIRTSSSTLTITNSDINENRAFQGGGIEAFQESYITLVGCSISNNTSDTGASISINTFPSNPSSLDQSTIKINQSTISGNTGIGVSGGVGVDNPSVIVISNSTISGNTGHGIYLGHSAVGLYNSTVSNNYFGRGISAVNGKLTLSNTIVAGNQTELVVSAASEFIDAGNNLIGDDRPESGFIATGLHPSTITATNDGNRPTPLSSILAPLADNGGATLTHGLPQGSPAIDAGSFNICSTVLVGLADQRGELRPQGDACDIGAFEGILETQTPFYVVPMPNGKSIIFTL